MEHFARDPRVLRGWATHAHSGEPLPPPLAARFCASRELVVASEWQVGLRVRPRVRLSVSVRVERLTLSPTPEPHVASEWQAQAMRALLDLELHSDVRHAPPERSAALARELAARHTGQTQPAEAAARGLAGFGHLASYGAGYYSYLWARSLSRRVWRECFEADPLRSEGGARWRDGVLRHGGAREPRQMLRELLAASASARAGAPPVEDEAEAALLDLVSLHESGAPQS